MPVFDTSIITKFVDVSTDLGGKGWVLKDYIIDVYPSLIPSVKTPALWLWGSNSNNQLGDNTAVSKSSPVQTIAGGVAWKQVACGGGHAAAVKGDGTLWLWGRNSNGQLGDNTTVGKSSPVQTVAGGTNWNQVACGYFFTAAIKTDGTLWTWGNGGYGRLGDNTVVSKSSPVQTVTGGTNWSQVACGATHMAAIKTDGTLWNWGLNNTGALGDNTITSSRSSPVQTVAGGTNWRQVSCGTVMTAAIKGDGTLWLWGNGGYGQLGINSAPARVASPVQTVTGGTNWRLVTCSSGTGSNAGHTAAVKTDGTLWIWGRNDNGQLGDNTTISKSSPVQAVTGGTNWKQVACGRGVAAGQGHTAAVKVDGTLWLWGLGTSGQLGDNTIVSKSSPVQTVAGGTTWKRVACGSFNFAAAIIDGNY